MNHPPVPLFDVRIHICEYEDILQYCGDMSNAGSSRIITYAHFDILLAARHSPLIKRLLNDAAVNYPDGIGVHWALTLLSGQRFPRINASDMNRQLIDHAIRHEWKIMTIGGDERVTRSCSTAFMNRGGREDLIRCFDGYRELHDGEIMNEIDSFQPAMILLGMGGEKQFAWLEILRTTGVPFLITGGGFLEFFGGTKPRAPLWMQHAGLEWLHRFLLEPRRLGKRYLLGIPHFVLLVLLEKLKRFRY